MNVSRAVFVFLYWLPTACALILCNTPLFDVLGYAFCLALTCCLAITSPFLAYTHASKDAWRTMFTVAQHLLWPLLVISANAFRIRNCNIPQGFLLYSFTALPSAAYGGTLGYLCKKYIPHKSALCLSIAVVLPLVWQGFLFYTQPPVFMYSHLWGFFSGPLYDEDVHVHAPLVFFRIGTVLRMGVLWACAYTWKRLRTPQRTLLCLMACVVCGSYDALVGPKKGFFVLRTHIQKALPVTLKAPGLVLHMPAHTTPEQQRNLLQDHVYRLDTLSKTLHTTPSRVLHSYVYTHPAHKAQWMGASHTMVAKPWLGEIHIHHVEVPHTTMPHEWVHVLASEWTHHPLGVPAQYGVFIHMPLVEGLAEAFAPPHGTRYLHTQAKLAWDLGKAPPMENMLTTRGFWHTSSSVAYTLTGSFIRYLADTYGLNTVRTAYTQASFNIPHLPALPSLIQQWRTFLNTVEASTQEKTSTQERFNTPSVFKRPCAQEVARLQNLLLQTPSRQKAYTLAEQLCDCQGNTPSAQLEKALTWNQYGYTEKALPLLHTLLHNIQLHPLQHTRILEALAMHAWNIHNLPEATQHLQTILHDPPNEASERLQWVRLWALQQSAHTHPQWQKFLQGRLDPLQTGLFLATQPQSPTVDYLIGRQLFTAHAYNEALVYLEKTPHPYPAIEQERLRLIAQTAMLTQDYTKARKHYTHLAKHSTQNIQKADAEEALQKIAWIQAQPHP